VLSCVRSYRERIAEYSEMTVLERWYSRIEAEDLLQIVKDKEARERHRKRLAQARARSVLEHDYPKLAAQSGRRPTIKNNPPLMFHLRDQNAERLLKRVSAASVRTARPCRKIGTCSSTISIFRT